MACSDRIINILLTANEGYPIPNSEYLQCNYCPFEYPLTLFTSFLHQNTRRSNFKNKRRSCLLIHLFLERLGMQLNQTGR